MTVRLVSCALLSAVVGGACRDARASGHAAAESVLEEVPNVRSANLPVPRPAPAPGDRSERAPQGARSAPPSFGEVSLASGFSPDPWTADGYSGGGVHAGGFATGCTGWIDERPDLLLTADTAFERLRVIANCGSRDATMVGLRPDGTYWCNDDALGRNPALEGRFESGLHKIWVGSYARGVSAPCKLGVTESEDVGVADLPIAR